MTIVRRTIATLLLTGCIGLAGGAALARECVGPEAGASPPPWRPLNRPGTRSCGTPSGVPHIYAKDTAAVFYGYRLRPSPEPRQHHPAPVRAKPVGEGPSILVPSTKRPRPGC
ncbi:hypothetical protein ACRAWD_30585 [Caulobacter segnis]